MKKVTLLTFALMFTLVFSSSAFAWGVTAKDNPFAAGKWMINFNTGFDIGMGTDSYELEDEDAVDTDMVELGFGLNGGYYILKGWEIGPAFRYAYDKSTDEDDNAVSASDYMFGIQTGYYYATPVPIHPFINVEAGYAGRSVNYSPDEGDETSDSAGGFAVRPSLGAVFFFSDKFALTPSLYYQYIAYSGTDDTSGDELDYDLTSSRFGFQLGLTGIF
ncbi:MAG TPA: outer membrane beta-barrel protein [bacterium]|nr:outer membrane beta-barrel protein [bacterium]